MKKWNIGTVQSNYIHLLTLKRIQYYLNNSESSHAVEKVNFHLPWTGIIDCTYKPTIKSKHNYDKNANRDFQYSLSKITSKFMEQNINYYGTDWI